MPHGLNRFQQSNQSHFVTFTCYHRQRGFSMPERYDLFVDVLEAMRRRFAMRINGDVVMPEHVHLLVSEPGHRLLADAIHYLKLSFAKRLRARGNLAAGAFWQKRYYDRNVRDEREFKQKLHYLHRNPVKRGLVQQPGEWQCSSFRHYALQERGTVEIESQWTASDRETRAFGGAKTIFLDPG